MNLLPPEIINRRKFYAQCKKLAAIQAVIFLSFVLIVLGLELIIELADARYAELNMLMADDRFVESERVAQVLREHRAQGVAQQAAATWLELPVFNIKRLEMVKETLPQGVELLHMEMDEFGAILTNYTINLSLADIHRDAWMATGLVSHVQLTSASTREDERIRYVLSIRWSYEY